MMQTRQAARDECVETRSQGETQKEAPYEKAAHIEEKRGATGTSETDRRSKKYDTTCRVAAVESRLSSRGDSRGYRRHFVRVVVIVSERCPPILLLLFR